MEMALFTRAEGVYSGVCVCVCVCEDGVRVLTPYNIEVPNSSSLKYLKEQDAGEWSGWRHHS